MSKPTVAVIGASADRTKYGNKAVRAYLQRGYEVYPVNPRAESIEGLKTCATIDDVPLDHLDRVTVYLTPQRTLEFIEQLAGRSIGELYLNPGSESEAAVNRARQLGHEPISACSIVAIGVSPATLQS